MRIVARCTPWLLAFVCLPCAAVPAQILVNDFGDAGPGDCNTMCTLRDAIVAALASVPIKGVGFSAAAGWPQTITLTQGQLTISNPSDSPFLVLGPGAEKLGVSGNNASRVLQVTAGTSQFRDITLRDGKVTGQSWGTEPFGSGNPGKTAGDATGGCIAIDAGAVLTIQTSVVRNCAAIGGTGGNGGSGVSVQIGSGGTGGNGGGGGGASGGGIYAAGNLSLIGSSVVDVSASGGPGGNGGNGGDGFPFNGTGGNGAPAGSATGAGIAVATAASIVIRNTTLARATATGGNGGNGGNGSAVNASGNGANGGNVSGGLLYAGSSVVVADLEFSTLANGTIQAGAGGFPGAVGTPVGQGGPPGVAHGTAIYSTGSNSAIFASSVVVGSTGSTLCYGMIAIDPGTENFDQDSSCTGFTRHGTFAEALLPQVPATTTSYTPLYKGKLVDVATSCTQIGGVVVVPDDQHGTPRPQGLKCDLGAVETDYVFADGFGGP